VTDGGTAGDAAPACPFARGGSELMRGLALARSITEARANGQAHFGLVYDERNTRHVELIEGWQSRMAVVAWSYQRLLAALAGTTTPGSWRAFLEERYGLVPSSERDIL
jgi:hypothetical protein